MKKLRYCVILPKAPAINLSIFLWLIYIFPTFDEFLPYFPFHSSKLSYTISLKKSKSFLRFALFAAFICLRPKKIDLMDSVRWRKVECDMRFLHVFFNFHWKIKGECRLFATHFNFWFCLFLCMFMLMCYCVYLSDMTNWRTRLIR